MRSAPPCERDPAFIVGAPRSGTFLVATMLDATPDVAVPFETHFVPLFRRVRFAWGDLARPRARRRLGRAVAAFLEIWTARAGRERDADSLRPYTLLRVLDDVDSLADGARCYADLVRGLFARYAAAHGKTRSADKSAFFAHVPCALIDDAVPGARIVHVIRDGRDVDRSWRAIWCGPLTVAESARRWRGHVRGARAWGAQHPDRYLELRYEDLLRDPDAALRRLTDFLGAAPPAGAARASGFADVLAEGSTHDRLAAPPDASRIERWREASSPRDIALFEAVAGDELEACGYARSAPRRGAWRFAPAIAWSFIPPLVAPRHWQVRVKNALPLLLLLAGPLRRVLVRLASGAPRSRAARHDGARRRAAG